MEIERHGMARDDLMASVGETVLLALDPADFPALRHARQINNLIHLDAQAPSVFLQPHQADPGRRFVMFAEGGQLTNHSTSCFMMRCNCPSDIEVSVTEDDHSRLVHLLNHGENPLKAGVVCQLSLPHTSKASGLRVISADGVSRQTDFELAKDVPNLHRIKFQFPRFTHYAVALVNYE